MQRKNLRVISVKDRNSLKLAKEVIERGNFVVAPSDTIYGIYAEALNYEAVQKLYRIRRPSGRKFIVLVPDLHWVRKLGLEVSKIEEKLLLLKAVTVILKKKTSLYHHLGINTVAVRVPKEGFIYELLKLMQKPVVAPSANLEGEPPARNIEEAINYFGENVELYVDGGIIEGKPSALVSVERERIKVLRKGPYSEEFFYRFFPIRTKKDFPS